MDRIYDEFRKAQETAISKLDEAYQDYRRRLTAGRGVRLVIPLHQPLTKTQQAVLKGRLYSLEKKATDADNVMLNVRLSSEIRDGIKALSKATGFSTSSDLIRALLEAAVRTGEPGVSALLEKAAKTADPEAAHKKARRRK